MSGRVIDIFYYGAVVYFRQTSEIVTFSSFKNVFAAGTITDGTQVSECGPFTPLSTNPIQTQIRKWGLKVNGSHTQLGDEIEFDLYREKIIQLNGVPLAKELRVYQRPWSAKLAVSTSDKLIFMKNEEQTELLCAMAVDRDGLWRVYGGHAENKETTAEGANREASEEGFIAPKTGKLKEFEVTRTVPAGVQESRRGWALKFVEDASSSASIKDVIWKHLSTFVNPNIETRVKEMQKKIEDACSSISAEIASVISIPITYNYQCKFMILPDKKVYRIVGTIPEDDSPKMQCGASYVLYEYNGQEINKVFKPKDKTERLLGKYLRRNQINDIIQRNLLRWDSHAVSIAEGYSFFNRYLARPDSNGSDEVNASLFPAGVYEAFKVKK